MKLIYFPLVAASLLTISCGPSETEMQQHEVKRDSVEQQLEDDWEDDLEGMMEETDSTTASADSTKEE